MTFGYYGDLVPMAARLRQVPICKAGMAFAVYMEKL